MKRGAQQSPAWEGESRCPRTRDAAAISVVDAELQDLERLGLDDLRMRWRNRWGRRAPARLSGSLLFRLMAYRIQAEAFGDLDRKTIKMLETLGAERDSGSGPVNAANESTGELVVDGESPRAARSKPSVITIDPGLILKPGTLLTREWQGRIERVMALGEGFAWNGKTYASLSAAAFAITGTKWNGQRFFGVRQCDRTRDAEHDGATRDRAAHGARGGRMKGTKGGSRVKTRTARGHTPAGAEVAQ